MYPLATIVRAKAKIAKNNLLSIRKHSPLKVGFILLMSTLLLSGGYFLLYKGLNFIENFSYFGPFLIDRLLSFSFIFLFFMLIFSHIITSFSIFYGHKETNFLFTLPLPHHDIFISRWTESLLLGSWASLVLVAPLIIAYGKVKSCSLYFYLTAFLPFIPFVIIAGAISSIIVLILVRFLPLRRSSTLIFALSFLLVPLLIFGLKFKGFREPGQDPFYFLSHLMKSLSFAQVKMLPNTWLTNSLSLAGGGNYGEALFYFLTLASNAFLALLILLSLVPKTYYKGFVRAKEVTSSTKPRKYIRLEPFFKFLPSPIKALTIKDIKLFARDPTQWIQFLIFFGLLFIYMANIKSMPYDISYPFWKGFILYLNLGAIGLILAALTTRFFFPLFSLEGKRFWIIGLAPLSRKALIYQKLFFSLLISLVITESLTIFSNIMLKTSYLIMSISCALTLLMTISLVSLSIGMGMIYPNLKEETPVRIVSGLGGTANAILSLFYVALTVITLSFPLQLYFKGILPASILTTAAALILFLNLLTTGLPLIIGFRNLEKMEF